MIDEEVGVVPSGRVLTRERAAFWSWGGVSWVGKWTVGVNGWWRDLRKLLGGGWLSQRGALLRAWLLMFD